MARERGDSLAPEGREEDRPTNIINKLTIVELLKPYDPSHSPVLFATLPFPSCFGDGHVSHFFEAICNSVANSSFFLGMQGHLWTETVRSTDQMYSMIFPRMIALAERAWHKAPWEDIADQKDRNAKRASDWVKFANALGDRELERLDKTGVAYRVPPPGVRLGEFIQFCKLYCLKRF